MRTRLLEGKELGEISAMVFQIQWLEYFICGEKIKMWGFLFFLFETKIQILEVPTAYKCHVFEQLH